MAAEDREAGIPDAEIEAEAVRAMLADWRLRLQGSQAQEHAARTEARRLARELALARRLLGFFLGNDSSMRPVRAAADEIPRLRAILLTERVLFSLDSCQNQGGQTMISGWAFRPIQEWDSRLARITLLLRCGSAVYVAAAAAGRVSRPDVAAHFASLPTEESGGARHLDGSGFACEILHDSLPEEMPWEIVLRLECGALVCEQPTGQHLRF